MITKRRKKEKPFRNILASLLFFSLILGVVGFLAVSNLSANKRREELNDRISSIKKGIEDLGNKKKELEVSASETGEEDYLEKVAREQLNLKKPGEEVVTILSPEQEQKKENETEEEKGFWQKILDPVRNFFEELY